jgi:uncharacterized membrane protein YdjX (TVP38/TMEM64 family)
MMRQLTNHQRNLLLAALAAAVVVLGLAGWALYHWREALVALPPPGELREAAHGALQSIPAPLYFLALVVLPAFGAPMSLFYLTALPALGTGHTVTGVLLVWLAVALNMVLCKLLTHGVFLPAIEWVIRHRHLSIPKIRRESEWKVVLATRLSPLPWTLQNYLLALGHARWRTYLWLSLPVQAAIGLGFMLVGESLLTGGLGYVLLAACLLIVLNIVLHALRKRFSREPAQPAS